MNFARIITTTAVVFLLMAQAAAAADENGNPAPGRSPKFDYIMDPGLITPDNFICGTRPPQDYLDAFNDAVARGEIPDPALKSESSANPPVLGTLYRDTISGLDLWLYLDVNGLLISDFSAGALFNLMTAA